MSRNRGAHRNRKNSLNSSTDLSSAKAVSKAVSRWTVSLPEGDLAIRLESARSALRPAHRDLDWAEAMFEIAAGLSQVRRWQDALDCLGEVMPIFSELKLPGRIAACYAAGASLLRELGALEDAARVFQAGADFYSLVQSYENVGICCWDQADVYSRLGRFDDAAESYARAEAAVVRAGSGAQAARCRKRRAFMMQRAHHLPEAVNGYREASEMFALEGDMLEAARCEMDQGSTLMAMGRPDEASALLESTLRVFENADDTVGKALCAMAFGCAQYQQGRFSAALNRLDEARELFMALGQADPVVRCDGNRAEVLAALGRLDEALLIYDSVHQRFSELGCWIEVARTERNRARVLIALHRDEDAFRAFDAASELFEECGESIEVEACEAERSMHLIARGNFGQVLGLNEYRKSRIAAGDEYEAAACDFTRGMALVRLDEAEHRMRLQGAGCPHYEPSGREPVTPGCDEAQSRALADLDRIGEAILALSSAREVFERFGRRMQLVKTQCGLGRSLERLDRRRDALACYLEACDVLDEALRRGGNTDTDQEALREQSPDPFEHAVRLLLYEADGERVPARRAVLVAQAFELSERARSQKLREDLVRSLSDEGVDLSSVAPELLVQWQRLVEELRALDCRAGTPSARGGRTMAQEVEAQAPDRARILGDLDEVEERVFRQDSEAGSLVSGRLPGIDDILASLNEDETMVTYYPAGADLALFILRRGEALSYVRVPNGSAAIREPLKDLNREIISACEAMGPVSGVEVWDRAMAKISEIVLGPLVDLDVIRTTGRLLIVPARKLHAVPFVALPVPSAVGPLVQHVAVSVLPQAATRHFQKDKRSRGSRRLAIIDPQSALPGGDRERDAVTEFVDELFFRDEGGEIGAIRFAELADDAYLLHVACHAVFEEKAPLSSALILGPHDAPERVSVRRLYGLHARPQIIVANACETARGTLVSGEALLGLSRAFLYLARYVVGTLWEVDDDAAVAFARCFHEALAQGEDPIDAVAIAQRQLISTPGFTHPYYWAGFRVSG